MVGTFQHDWKDLDGRAKFTQADSADAQASMGSSLAGEQQSYNRPDLSLAQEVFPPGDFEGRLRQKRLFETTVESRFRLAFVHLVLKRNDSGSKLVVDSPQRPA